jgi:molybdate/tungstate transport system substrate-binding protein
LFESFFYTFIPEMHMCAYRYYSIMKKLSKIFVLVITLSLITIACNAPEKQNATNELIVFHAGSLTKPFHEITQSFEAENPGVRVLLEAAGSRECARKITELKKPCDIIATSDYAVIETLLIPEYADWQIAFAGNEMCIAYNSSSRMSKKISYDNWYDILLNDSVYFGRADPEADPCGYRTVIMFDLSEKYYKTKGLADRLKQKDQAFIRPKEVDMLALLESKAIDYMFIYSSVAKQHQLSFLKLPDEINLGNPAFTDFYATASVELSGKSKNDKIIQKGEPMIYGISILKNAPNRALAEKFLNFLLTHDKGMKIMEQNGQQIIVDSNSKYVEKFPHEIKKLFKR